MFAERSKSVAIWVLGASVCIAFCIFNSLIFHYTLRRYFVPKRSHVQEVYFDFSSRDTRPWYLADLHPFPAIDPGFDYSVDLVLVLPDSHTNRELGMMMASLDFLGASQNILARSSRPFMTPYVSEMVRTLYTMLASGVLVTGLTHEQHTLRINMLRDWSVSDHIRKFRAELSQPFVQVYRAYLEFHVTLPFGSLSYFLFYHSILSGVVIITSTFLVQVTCLAVLYIMYRVVSASRSQPFGDGDPRPRLGQQPRGDDSSDASDTDATNTSNSNANNNSNSSSNNNDTDNRNDTGSTSAVQVREVKAEHSDSASSTHSDVAETHTSQLRQRVVPHQ